MGLIQRGKATDSGFLITCCSGEYLDSRKKDRSVSSKERQKGRPAGDSTVLRNDKIHILRLTGVCPIREISVMILRVMYKWAEYVAHVVLKPYA
jgi:hypothetical protein